MRVRRRRNRTRRPRARDGWEEDPLPHAVTMRTRLGAEERNAQIRRAAFGDRDGHRRAVRPVRVLNREGRLRETREEVRGREDLDAVFLRIDVIFWIGAGDHDAAVLEEDGFGVVEAGDDGVCHDGDAGADGLAGVVEEGVEVGRGGEAEAGLALVGAVEDQEGAVGEGADAGHDALRGHALQGPLRRRGFRLGGDAVVESDACVGGRAAADQDGQGISVRCALRHEHGCAFERISAASLEVVDGTGDHGQLLRCCEGALVQDPGFVVVGDEDSTGWQDGQERIEVVRVSAIEEIKVHYRVASDWVGKYLQRWDRWSV